MPRDHAGKHEEKYIRYPAGRHIENILAALLAERTASAENIKYSKYLLMNTKLCYSDVMTHIWARVCASICIFCDLHNDKDIYGWRKRAQRMDAESRRKKIKRSIMISILKNIIFFYPIIFTLDSMIISLNNYCFTMINY